MLNGNESDYFYLTNTNCKAVSVTNDFTLEKAKAFLIFNSNLYYENLNDQNTCYYFDKYTNNYFMTVSSVYCN